MLGEIRRNSFEGKYDTPDAQVTAMARRKFARKATKQSPEVLQIVRKGLRLGWPHVSTTEWQTLLER
jgi:IS30 family transposase